MGGCMDQWVGSGQMTNLIKLELINIIWFCLKIYNLSRHPYLWVDGWVNGWAHVKSLKSNKSWPNRDNSIMDILDILLDILLKPPQPLIGLFFSEIFPQQIWQKIECNVNFKQWFNVFLIISEVWQGHDSKAYGVSNHNLKLQCKKFSGTRDIPNFPTQGWEGTAFCTRKRSETYVCQLWSGHSKQNSKKRSRGYITQNGFSNLTREVTTEYNDQFYSTARQRSCGKVDLMFSIQCDHYLWCNGTHNTGIPPPDMGPQCTGSPAPPLGYGIPQYRDPRTWSNLFIIKTVCIQFNAFL